MLLNFFFKNEWNNVNGTKWNDIMCWCLVACVFFWWLE